MNMKVCILTGKFGMGHLAAAQAIKQQIDASTLDADIEIIDWLQYATPRFADKYYSFYSFLVKNGRGFYNTWYRFFENRKTNQKPELSSYSTLCFSKLMEERKPDLIISTLPLCSQTVSFYKEKTNCSIPLITCVTDITGHSEWISKNTELYLVGSHVVKEKFIEKGVSPEKIHVTGIPVRLDFIKNSSFKRRNKDNSIKKLLFMGGGLGMLPDDLEFYYNLNLLPDIEVTVITGKNDKLYHHLIGRYENIKVLGFIENIGDYMRQADLIVTKPGGITTFEAIHSEVPIIALNPYLQQEIYNANYIEEMHIGTVVNGNSSRCLQDLISILEHEKLDNYRYHIKQIKGQLEENTLLEVLKDVIHIEDRNKGGLKNRYQSRNEEIAINEKISFNI